MIFHPGILALLLSSLITVFMTCYSCVEGMRIIRSWDIKSGSEYQLEMERKTYLISTIMGYVMGFQVLALFLLVYTADTLSHLFIGAMCAAGSFNVNNFGYPALMLELVACISAGVWLIINHTDNSAPDYPLIRKKYWLLLGLAPLMIVAAIVQSLYLLTLDPDIITSCCSVIFSDTSGTVMSDVVSLPPRVTMVVFFVSGLLVVALALRVFYRSRGAVWLALFAFLHLIISIVATIVFISIYIYELPTHHCPFCILHSEYYFIGYCLYLFGLITTIAGMGTGMINPCRSIPSLNSIVPRLQRGLSLVTAVSTALFLVVSAGSVWFSNLKLW